MPSRSRRASTRCPRGKTQCSPWYRRGSARREALKDVRLDEGEQTRTCKSSASASLRRSRGSTTEQPRKPAGRLVAYAYGLPGRPGPRGGCGASRTLGIGVCGATLETTCTGATTYYSYHYKTDLAPGPAGCCVQRKPHTTRTPPSEALGPSPALRRGAPNTTTGLLLTPVAVAQPLLHRDGRRRHGAVWCFELDPN